MATISASNFPPNFPKYSCEQCHIKTNNKKDYNNHMMTAKHKNNSMPQQPAINVLQVFKCTSCKKEYESRSGLWRHEKKCKSAIEKNENEEEINIKFLTKLVLEVVKSNAELQKQMLEVCQNGIGNVMNNSHNKTFNLNFFLNEQCKDAMNIMDFVDTFKLDFTDLDNVGKLGYVEGISNIIIQKLNEMDIYKRPIHCSDLKRETTHVKDKGIWEKDNGNHDKLRLAIRHVTQKNIKLLNPWIEAHPQAQASAHYLNDVYMNYIKQSMGGKGDLDDNEAKIIKKIAKVILIDK